MFKENKECFERIREILYNTHNFPSLIPEILRQFLSLIYFKIPIINFDEIEELIDKFSNDYKYINEERCIEDYNDIVIRDIDLNNITIDFYTAFLNKLKL
jgi:hypothetical protein